MEKLMHKLFTAVDVIQWQRSDRVQGLSAAGRVRAPQMAIRGGD